MKPLFCTNDIHLGVNRTGGTTPASAFALRKATLESFRNLLDMCPGDTIINGDTFDAKNINLADLWEAVKVVSDWLTGEDYKLYLPYGNHCISRNSEEVASFDLFCNILVEMFPSQVFPITQPTYIKEHDAYVICHLQNQDLFDAALKQVPECTYVFLHCNYNNKFAVQADHSLNITPEQALSLPCKRIIFGHEHHGRKELGGKVVVVGNQVPTSISDCLGNKTKYMLKISDTLEFIPTWQAAGDFAEMHWSDLKDTGARFIRAVGEAGSAEAGDAVAAVSRFRSKSTALVITNAVKVEGAADAQELVLNAEEIRAFDVRSALMEILTIEERSVIEGVLTAQ